MIDGGSEDAAALEPLLKDGETVRYVLRSSKGIEKTTEGRTTTVQSKSNHDAYAIVTDFRLLFLVGSDAENSSIDIEFDLGTVTSRKARTGLLSTSLLAVSDDAEVKFTPSSGPDLETVADYIDRIGGAWSDLDSALMAAREAIGAFEESLKAGENGNEALTRARSRLSNAHHHATVHTDGPVEAMQALIEPVEAELGQLQVQTRLDRVDDLLVEAEAESSFADAVESLVEASERLEEARDALDGDDAIEPIEDRATAIDELARSTLADTEDCCLRALEATDAGAAATAWETAHQRYRALDAADWDGLGGVDDDAIAFQLAWVVGRRIDALTDLAADLEAEGDELDDATESYERARAQVESASAIADEYPHTNADRFDDRLDELQEKIDVSEWQWGDA